MNKEALSIGFYTFKYFEKDYPKIKIFPIEQLLNSDKVQMPTVRVTFRKAERIKNDVEQDKLGIYIVIIFSLL